MERPRPGRPAVVVTKDPAHLQAAVGALRAAGYAARGVASFQEGRQLLEQVPDPQLPDLIVVDERLGPFNGLHLIMLGRVHRPEMGAIVMSAEADAYLKREAHRLHVEHLVKPSHAWEWRLRLTRALQRMASDAWPQSA